MSHPSCGEFQNGTQGLKAIPFDLNAALKGRSFTVVSTAVFCRAKERGAPDDFGRLDERSGALDRRWKSGALAPRQRLKIAPMWQSGPLGPRKSLPQGTGL